MKAKIIKGRDKYGKYLDFIIKRVTQRFRWCPPGTFMMGSPEEEGGRCCCREDLHEVTLTEGFWLADTAVTQELWQVVEKHNPARFFTGKNNPVEMVNHMKVGWWINRLNSRVSEISFRLPWEAEWEYACRAGTNTPFSFEEFINYEKVNYLYIKGRTVPVKSLPCNNWGLYEMHGNVWEWCLDPWKERLENKPVTNPFNETGLLEEYRTIRGGAWDCDYEDVRSASRRRKRATNMYLPDGHPPLEFDNLGFRLAIKNFKND